MPKFPAKSRVELEKERLRNLYASQLAQAGGLGWSQVLITFVVFAILGVAAIYPCARSRAARSLASSQKSVTAGALSVRFLGGDPRLPVLRFRRAA